MILYEFFFGKWTPREGELLGFFQNFSHEYPRLDLPEKREKNSVDFLYSSPSRWINSSVNKNKWYEFVHIIQ